MHKSQRVSFNMDNICIKLHRGYPTGKHQDLQKQRSVLNRSGTDPSVCCSVFPSPETDKRKSLIQLIHLRPSSPPLFVCPFSVFSPYICPSIPPLCFSLSTHRPAASLCSTATGTGPPFFYGPAGKPEMPQAHPDQERPSIVLRPH